MLIFKSFLRKKTTKTYLLIYTIILATLFTLLITKNVMIELENNNYKGSFIEIEDKNNIQIDRLNNIDKIYQAISIKDGYNKIFLISDESYDLKNSEIIIPIKYKEEIKVGDIFELEVGDNSYNFVVKSYSNSKNNNVLVVSSKFINENKGLDNSYLLTLKNWLKKEQTLDEIRDKYKDYNISSYFYTSNDTYTTFITIINILLSVLTFLFIIILVVTSVNIIEDEKKKNEIYYKLGYLKTKLQRYNVIKIISLIVTIFYILYNLL